MHLPPKLISVDFDCEITMLLECGHTLSFTGEEAYANKLLLDASPLYRYCNKKCTNKTEKVIKITVKNKKNESKNSVTLKYPEYEHYKKKLKATLELKNLANNISVTINNFFKERALKSYCSYCFLERDELGDCNCTQYYGG